MNITDILVLLIGGLVTIIGYFLTKTMNKLDETAVKTDINSGAIALLKQETSLKHDRLEEKLDDLKDVIVELTDEIKTLNKKA